MKKLLPTIGCCGIDCGLCPRFYTSGKSRCPGCGGEEFDSKHPPCSYITCCVKKHGLEVCSQCDEFPCPKFKDKPKIERDSFVTHKRIFNNHQTIKALGLRNYLIEQNERVTLLQDMLTGFDDGRSKSFYCLAAALLPPKDIRGAIDQAKAAESDIKSRAKALKAAVARAAEINGVVLALEK